MSSVLTVTNQGAGAATRYMTLNRIFLLFKSLMFVLPAMVSGCIQPGEPLKDGFISGADNVRLYYQIRGAGHDTLVVVHGGPGAGMNAIQPDLTPLHRRHTVIYFDQRGGGMSDLPADTSQLTAALFVEDLEAVRRRFHMQSMNVLAHSFGSVIVAEYATRYPDRLRRVIFLGATGPKRSEAAQYAQSEYAEADSTLRRPVFDLLSELMGGEAADPVETCHRYHEAGQALAAAEGRAAFGKGSECDMPPKALSYYFQYTAQVGPASFGDWNYTNRLSYVPAPLLVIFGSEDSTALSMQRDWADAFPNGRLLPLPEAGKAVHVERPDAVFPAIERFLRGDWPTGAL